MRAVLARTPSVRMRLFSAEEQAYCDTKARPEVHYALRYAAKRAVYKALGAGFVGLALRDVEVGTDMRGRPVAILCGRAGELASAQGVVEMHLSLSHTRSVAVANAVAATPDSLPVREERPDPKAELAAAFKEARALLDEIGAPALETEPEEEGVDPHAESRLPD